MANFQATTTTEPYQGAPCWLCKRRDDGIGAFVSDRGGKLKAVWSCIDHIDLLSKAKFMPQKEFDHLESGSVVVGGEKGGQYLDKIGKTDLASLELYEWLEFLKIVIRGYGDHLAEQLQFKDGVPF